MRKRGSLRMECEVGDYSGLFPKVTAPARLKDALRAFAIGVKNGADITLSKEKLEIKYTPGRGNSSSMGEHTLEKFYASNGGDISSLRRLIAKQCKPQPTPKS